MKRLITILICYAVAVSAAPATANQAADAPASNSGKNKKPANPPAAAKARPKPPAPLVTIPADAVKLPNGSYRYTDKDGKNWIYSNTPFGVSKFEETEAPQATGADPTKAIDKGDVVRFERPSPFGTMSWEKKKTELTDDERHILEAQTPKPEPGPENK